MYKLLIVKTEVNDVKITFYGKMFLEYPEDENHKCLQHEAEIAVAKLTGISRFKIEEAGNYLWNYEDYDEAKHSNLDITDLDNIYEPIFKHSS